MVINCTAEMECKSQTIDVAAVETYFNVRDWRSEELQGGCPVLPGHRHEAGADRVTVAMSLLEGTQHPATLTSPRSERDM